MLPTRGLLGLLLFPAALLAAWSFLPWLGVPTLGALLGALALIGVEWRLLPHMRDVAVRRRHEPRLSLGAATGVWTDVANATPRPLAFVLRDATPADCVTSALFLDGVAPACGTVTVRYMLRPLRRGDHRFGDVTLRWAGPLGLLR